MADLLTIKRNDLQPYYYVTVTDDAGTAINLTGASIVCNMKGRRTGALKIDRQSAGISITTPASGQFEYRWQSGDTDTAGEYYIEFEITPTTGGKFTIPAKSSDAMVKIEEDLDGE